MNRYYKLARPSGWDFYTGKTINYLDNIGKTVSPPNPDRAKGLCSNGLIHASSKPLDCFVGAYIPCSAYIVEGMPILCDSVKCGFTELMVLEEITDLDELFQFKYTEACNPINPLLMDAKLTEQHKILLKEWISVGASVVDSVGASVGASVWDSVGDSVWDFVGDSVRASVWAPVWDSGWASGWASVWAYIGSLFPHIAKWEYIGHEKGEYPFQSAVDLWQSGFVPTFDGKTWRLHAGKEAKVVYEMEVKSGK